MDIFLSYGVWEIGMFKKKGREEKDTQIVNVLIVKIRLLFQLSKEEIRSSWVKLLHETHLVK